MKNEFQLLLCILVPIAIVVCAYLWARYNDKKK